MGNAHRKKVPLRRWFQASVSAGFLCFFAVVSADAETISTASLKKGYTTAELDQMLAPVALYPDGLLLQVLMASSHPAEVVEAGRWLDANPDLSGDTAVEAAESFGWHASVMALLAFPDVLFTMSSNMEWAVKLGNAFTAQREDMMERVQHLRRQARAAGNLKSDERMNVIRTSNNIAIEPVSREVIYVPYYNPAIVYGSWAWPGYAPYYWSPWRGYAWYPGYYSSSFMWGSGIWFSYTRFHGRMDWRRRHVHWNPPPKYTAPGHVRPGVKPHPGQNHARPGNRPGQNGHNQARPGVRPGDASSGHVRPGYIRPGLNRPSTITSRPGQRPGMAAAYRQAHNRSATTGHPSRSMGYNHPSATHQDVSAVHTRMSRGSQSAVRQPAGTHQSGGMARASSRPAMTPPANVSRQAGLRPGGWFSQGGGHKGGARR
ncbi:DUF3300 domain-containing protein [Oxalobacter vibrioformis]|uniref:DUF3300 domain-containing protein n=1 Tax=Oxalobacter vibrioformis TaxID=933080 RepID=A0A9E9LWP5_9BURK|nr:DUF3300 domain-containing protein [Oxalobacter vibrioformis]WAW09656.1 DUF3300 domain-containing protein [Oxalobacter vibrioformis]